MHCNRKPPAGGESAPEASPETITRKLGPRPRLVNGTAVNCREWLPLRTGPGRRTWLPADFVRLLRKGAT